MPYENEHACRLKDPAQFDTCRRGIRTATEPESVKGKKYSVIWCKKGDGRMEEQAYRYSVKSWTEEQARKHCDHHDGQFEAAKKDEDAKPPVGETKMLERRYLPIEQVEMRAAEDDLELEGYGAVFGVEAVIWNAWREELAPGAYAKTIRENDIRSLFNHDPNVVLGRNRAGTLKLAEDQHGLKTIIRPPDNEWGRPVVEAVRRGDVTGMSVMFEVIKHEWTRPPEGSKELPKRTIKEAKLYDVGPVTFPAFEETSIAARSIEGVPLELEDVLREARRIERCAAHGMELTRADREVLERAVAILTERMAQAEPEPDGGDTVGGHHSAGEPEPGGGDADRGHHSAEVRERWLALVEKTL